MRIHVQPVLWPALLGMAFVAISIPGGAVQAQVDVPALVRDMRSKEQWIHEVNSFHVKLTCGWSATKATVEKRWKALSLRLPALDEPSSVDYLELRGYIPERLEIAFDDSRMYFRSYWEDTKFDLRCWDDGQMTALGGRTPDEITHYGLDDEPNNMLGSFLLEQMSWLRGTFHSFWWDRFESQPRTDILLGEAEEFTLAGQVEYRGVRCHVLESRGGFLSWYIGVEDHLLRGHLRRVLKDDIDVMPVIEEIGRREGMTFENERAYLQWKFAQPPLKRRRLNAEYFGALVSQTRPEVEYFMDEYVEVSTDRWYPMVQGQEFFTTEPDGDGVYSVATSRDLRTTEITIDAPLPDSMFDHEMIEGVEVNDWRYDPMIIYPYQPGMNVSEELLVLAKLNFDPRRYEAAQAFRDELIGSFPPEFPDTTWYNSEPLTWSQLRGQVVIVAFWAGWYEPCFEEIMRIRVMHELKDLTDIVVIGIHPPGSDESYMRSAIGKFRMKLPICMDIPQRESVRGWGELFKQYRVEGVPHAFMIDVDGRIAGHGTINEVVALTRKLH